MKDVRTQLLKMSGELPISAPMDAPPSVVVKVKQKKEDENEEAAEPVEEDAAVEMHLEFTIVNDFLGIRLTNLDNDAAVRVAQSFGFKHPPSYFAAKIPQPIKLLNLFKKWRDLGFHIDKANSIACKTAYDHFKASKMTAPNFFGLASDNNIRNFYRLDFKPDSDKTHIFPYPLIQDGVLYIGLPRSGHPGSIPAMRKAIIPGIKWFLYDSKEELIIFTPKKQRAVQLLKTLQREGVVIPNIKDLNKELTRLRIARDSKVEEDDVI